MTAHSGKPIGGVVSELDALVGSLGQRKSANVLVLRNHIFNNSWRQRAPLQPRLPLLRQVVGAVILQGLQGPQQLVALQVQEVALQVVVRRQAPQQAPAPLAGHQALEQDPELLVERAVLGKW